MKQSCYTQHNILKLKLMELTECPLDSIKTALCQSVRDMSENKTDAWVFGIVCGWDDISYNELSIKFNWSKENIERNKRLHNQYKNLFLYDNYNKV